MSIALDAFKATLDEIARSEPWGDGELLVTPWEFSDQEPIVLYVRALDGTYVVSDRGQAADNLNLAGLDFQKAAVSRSWLAIQQSVENDPFVHRIQSKWELAARSDFADLGLAIHQVAEAAMRADGLRVLTGGRSNAPRFETWVIKEAHEEGLIVVPRAEIESTFGFKRRVSVLVEGKRKAYIQAVGPTQDVWDSFDRARSLFADSTLDFNERFTVLSRDSALSGEQVKAIAKYSDVVDEKDYTGLLKQVA